jgi:hypothetical protein
MMLKSLLILRSQLSKQGERSAAIPATGAAPTRAIHHGIMPGSAKGVEWKGFQMFEDAMPQRQLLPLNPYRRQILLFMAAGLTGCTNIVENQDMDNSTRHAKNFTEHWSKIKFWDGAVPASMHTSYPVPALRRKQVQIAYMVCPYIFNPKGSWIWPPNKLAWFDPVSGKITDEIFVSPDFFGQTDDAGVQLKGNLSVPSDKRDALDNSRKRLFVLYDALFDAWMMNPSASGHDKLKDSAREFLNIFDQVSEPGLKPYYDFLGREYFGWLRSVANRP